MWIRRRLTGPAKRRVGRGGLDLACGHGPGHQLMDPHGRRIVCTDRVGDQLEMEFLKTLQELPEAGADRLDQCPTAFPQSAARLVTATDSAPIAIRLPTVGGHLGIKRA